MAMLTLEFGMLADQPSVQLASVIADTKFLERLDVLANAVSVCVVNGLISHSAADTARDRIMTKIKAEINAQAKPPAPAVEAPAWYHGDIDGDSL
jgi:hypothetical protein